MTATLNRYELTTPGRKDSVAVNSYVDVAKGWVRLVWENNQWNFKGVHKRPLHSLVGIWVTAKRVDEKAYLVEGKVENL